MSAQPTTDKQARHRIQLTGVRRMIADRMTQSHQQIPAVTIAEDCDVTGLDLHLLLGHAIACLGRTVADFPVLNAHLTGDQLSMFDRCDVGVAIDTPSGLLVPVVRDCAAKTSHQVQAEVHDLAGRARSGTLTAPQMRGATITLTSPGRRGGTLATPMINPPQTCIVGIHRATPRPMVVHGQVIARMGCTLTVTFDHRVIDGATAGDFTLALARAIQTPTGGEKADQP